MIEIWQPRWKDRRVLIAKYKVRGDYVSIRFTKAPSIRKDVFKLPSDEIRKFPVESNGTIDCYSVPLETVIGTEKG